eukprot:2100423-Prymnesium_polylepis.1
MYNIKTGALGVVALATTFNLPIMAAEWQLEALRVLCVAALATTINLPDMAGEPAAAPWSPSSLRRCEC